MNKATLSQLTVGGFQSLRDRVDIPIAPMTFLFGPNSAGKSTLIDAVRLLRGLTNPAPSSEIIAEVKAAVERDAHGGVILGAEISELPGELPDFFHRSDEQERKGRDAGEEIWKRMKGSRVQLEVDHPVDSSLKVFVDGELLIAREAETFDILLDDNLRLPGDAAYVPPPSDSERPSFRDLLRVNVCHAVWKGTDIEEQLQALTSWIADADSPEVRACLRREGDFVVVGGVATDWFRPGFSDDLGLQPFLLQADRGLQSLANWLTESPEMIGWHNWDPALAAKLFEAQDRSDWEQERGAVLDVVLALCEGLQSLVRMLHVTVHEALTIPLVPADRGTLKPTDAFIEFDPDSSVSEGMDMAGGPHTAIQRYAAWHALRDYGAPAEHSMRAFDQRVWQSSPAEYRRPMPSRFAFEGRDDFVNTVLERDLVLGAGYKVCAETWRMQPLQQRKVRRQFPHDPDPPMNRVTSALYLVDRQGRDLDFKDVGSGVSYVLPVLVTLWDAQRSWVEQPELHLHPAAQCGLGDVFIRAFNRGHFSIVETHSEHMLLRVLRRIRESTAGRTADPELRCSPESVSVLYFEPKDDGSTTVHPLRVTRGGDFMDRWPLGFFDERERELFDE